MNYEVDMKYYITTLILVIPLWGIYEAKEEPTKSGLCNKSAVYSSCSHQLWDSNASLTDCTLWNPYNHMREIPLKNSNDCCEWSIGEDGLKTSTDLVKVKLRAYYFIHNQHGTTYRYTAFNATFSDIKWNDLRMRYKQVVNKDITCKDLSVKSNSHNNFCRDFTIVSSGAVPERSELFYDCLWAPSNTIEGTTFAFEYRASNEQYATVGKYLFKVPNSSYIDPHNRDPKQSELFMYIDTTSLPLLKLRVQTVQDRFNTSTNSYIVELHHKKSSGKITSPTHLTATIVEEDELTFEYDTNCEKGDYYFTAHINHIDYDGVPFISESPTVPIKGDCGQTILLITIVGCGAVVLSVVSFAFFLWRKRASAMRNPPPTVLIIYSATTTKHHLAALELAKFLSNFCYVNALIDDLEIPKSKKSPFTWCNDAFSQSKFVMILSSPFHQCNNYEGIYRRVDALGLSLVANNMGDRKSNIGYFSVLLPYCTKNDIPAVAKNLRRFTLMADLNKMLGLIHAGSTSLFNEYCVEPLIYGGKSALRTDGVSLLKAIKAAASELAERNTNCNCSHVEHSLQLEPGFVDIDISDEFSAFATFPREERKDLDEFQPIHEANINDMNLLGEVEQKESDNAICKQSPRYGFNINDLNL